MIGKQDGGKVFHLPSTSQTPDVVQTGADEVYG